MIPYIDGLPVATSVASTDLIAVDQGGVAGQPGTATTRQALLSQIFGAGPGAGFLPLIGGTMTGALTLSGDPVVALGAATKQYVDRFLPIAGGTITGNLAVTGTTTLAGVLSSGQVQALRFTTGVNAFAPASTALTPLILSGATVTGTVVGAGAWNSATIASDTADFTAAADNSGKIWNLQYNFSGTAKGARTGLWAQMNPVSLSNTIDMVAVSANITANSAMGGSFLQPISSIVGIGASATNVGSTLNEFDYYTLANVVGVKGALQITLARGDLFQGLSADAGVFFSNSNDFNTSPGMKAAIALGTTNQGFPIGSNGSVLTILPQIANQGSGQNVQFIQPAISQGIDLQFLNTSIQSGNAFRSPGFSVDGAGQVTAAQGLRLGRSGTSYTIDTPSTFAVNTIVPNVAGAPTVSANSSRGNYYPGDIVNGSGSPAGQYQITHCKVLSAAVTAAGSGGTNGAQVVTLSGGSGSAATVNVTVSGGVITAVNSIATAGDYTAFPVNLNAVPVTGASLTGATLAVGMGALTVAVLVPDVFATNITAITPVGGSGTGLTLTATNQVRSELSLQPTAGGTARVGSGMITANGIVATALTAVGPTGSHTTVQEWMTVTNPAGVVRWIPMF